jgi:phosphatidylserine/phosphatidylglycerophosphate/cardiolipin synthase-like enzyme
VLFNAADINRGTRRAYERVIAYFNNPVDWWDKDDADETDPDETDPDETDPDSVHYREGIVYATPGYGVESQDFYSGNERLRLIVLGSGDWTEGVMHHKFIICDDIVWLGSYNFTFQARKNYETLIRIDDKAITKQFHDETERLVNEPNKHFSTLANGVFSCSDCGKTFPRKELGYSFDQTYGGDEGYICKRCDRKQDKYLK